VHAVGLLVGNAVVGDDVGDGVGLAELGAAVVGLLDGAAVVGEAMGSVVVGTRWAGMAVVGLVVGDAVVGTPWMWRWDYCREQSLWGTPRVAMASWWATSWAPLSSATSSH